MGLGVFEAAVHPAADHRLQPGRLTGRLCAWIIEKFWSWTDCDGDPANVLTRDEMLDNVMMYWLPGTGARPPGCTGKASASPSAGR